MTGAKTEIKETPHPSALPATRDLQIAFPWAFRYSFSNKE